MIRLLLLLSFLLYSCSSTSTEYRSAKTYVGQRDYNQAEEIALQGIINNPDDALIAYYLAAVIYGSKTSPKKNYAKAGEYFNLALERDNKDNEDQLLPEPIFVFKGNESIELITVKDAVNHERYMIWGDLYNQGVDLFNEQQKDKAITPLELAILVDPDNALTYAVLCEIFYKMGEKYFSQSIQNANKALSLDDSLTDLLVYKAEIAKSNDDFIKAEKYLDQAYKTAIKN